MGIAVFGVIAIGVALLQFRFPALRLASWPYEPVVLLCAGAALVLAVPAVVLMREDGVARALGLVGAVVTAAFAIGAVVAMLWLPPSVRRRLGPWDVQAALPPTVRKRSNDHDS